MKFFELYEGRSRHTDTKEPEWQLHYDIIVAGGGTSGCYCALAAAREGKKVLVIEKSRWCGGTHIQGLINGYYYGSRGGLYQNTDEEGLAMAGQCFYDVTDAKRLVLSDTLRRNGIDVSVFSVITGLYTEGQHIVGVMACMDGQLLTVKCSMLVDATGDGHVLRQLPLIFHRGRKWDHGVQPFSSVRCIYLDKGGYDGGCRVEAGSASDRYGIYHEYRDNGYVDQYDAWHFTSHIIRAHASHLDTLDPNARFLYLAPQIGVREGISFEGEQFLTLEEVLTQDKAPENVLLYCFSDVDKHGHDLAFDEDTYQDWFVNCNLSTCTVYIPIPVGCMVPKDWKGILSAGRCLSADSYVNSATRMNTDCFRIGEACGVLAAMAVDHAQDPMRVPRQALQDRLAQNGFFENNPLLPPSFWTPALSDNRRFVTWMTEADQIREALSTDKPSVALWSCRRLGKEAIGDQVYEMTKSEDEMLRHNAAVALGIMQDERALPILHEIIKDRKPFYFMDCRRSNQMRSVIAICLCGRMGDTGIVDELLQIIRPEEFENPIYHRLLKPCYELSITKELNSVYYQHFSHAVAALVKIALTHEEYRERITEALHAALDDDTYIRRMTDQPEYNAFYQAALNCRRFFQEHLM